MRRRGKGGFLVPHNQTLQVDGAHQLRKAAYLGEGKLWLKTSAALWQYAVMKKASGVNLKEKSRVRTPKAAWRCPQLHSGSSRWCQTVAALLFLWIHQWGGEGGQVAWATACPPYYNAQAYIHPCHQLYTHTCTWRGHSSFAIYMVLTQHGGQQIPVISHHSIGIECSARGCFWWWERSSCLIGQLMPTSSWAAPSQ